MIISPLQKPVESQANEKHSWKEAHMFAMLECRDAALCDEPPPPPPPPPPIRPGLGGVR